MSWCNCGPGDTCVSVTSRTLREEYHCKIRAVSSHEQLLAACHAMCWVIAHEPEPTLKDAILLAYEQMKTAINAAEEAN